MPMPTGPAVTMGQRYQDLRSCSGSGFRADTRRTITEALRMTQGSYAPDRGRYHGLSPQDRAAH